MFIKTNTDLDKLIDRGFLKGTINLIEGNSGAGKTVLCLKLVSELSKKGFSCVYISLEQMRDEILIQSKLLNIDLDIDKVEIIDFVKSSFDLLDVINRIIDQAPDILIIDSLSALEEHPSYILEAAKTEFTISKMNSLFIDREKWLKRLLLMKLYNKIKKNNILCFITVGYDYNKEEILGTSSAEYLSDCVIRILVESLGGEENRIIGVVKKRYGNHLKGTYKISLCSGGFNISTEMGAGLISK